MKSHIISLTLFLACALMLVGCVTPSAKVEPEVNVNWTAEQYEMVLQSIETNQQMVRKQCGKDTANGYAIDLNGIYKMEYDEAMDLIVLLREHNVAHFSENVTGEWRENDISHKSDANN